MDLKYGDDRYNWAMENTSLSSEKCELVNRLSIIITCLLKWQFQSYLRGYALDKIIKLQRKQAQAVLEGNPILKRRLEEVLVDAYKLVSGQTENRLLLNYMFESLGRIDAVLKVVPLVCPYTIWQCLNNEFYPD